MTKTQLNCPKAKSLCGHNSKEKAKLLISDDFHTQPSAKRIVLQHQQNPLEFPLKRQKSLNEDTKCLKCRNRTCQLSAVQCSKTVKQTLRLTKGVPYKALYLVCVLTVSVWQTSGIRSWAAVMCVSCWQSCRFFQVILKQWHHPYRHTPVSSGSSSHLPAFKGTVKVPQKNKTKKNVIKKIICLNRLSHVSRCQTVHSRQIWPHSDSKYDLRQLTETEYRDSLPNINKHEH